MELTVNKKKVLKISLVVLIVLIVGGILAYLMSFREKELTVYDRLYEHCTKEGIGVRKCNVFLSDFSKDGNKTCLDLVLPVVKVDQRDIQICIEGDVNWENPYEDYSRVIPVTLNVDYIYRILEEDVIEKIDIELLEDKGAYELMDKVNLVTENTIDPILIGAVENATRGYAFYPYSRYGQGDELLALGLLNVRINSFKIVDKEIQLQIEFEIEGMSYSYSFTTTEIRFYPQGNAPIITLTANDDLGQYIDKERGYVTTFVVYSTETDTPLLATYEGVLEDVKNYLEGVESEILLKLEMISE